MDPRPAPARPLADAPPEAPEGRSGGTRAGGSGAPQEKLSINRLVERWGDVIARVRADGRAFLAAALEHGLPTAVSGRGEITLELEGGGALYQQPIAAGAADVLAAVGAFFTGATKLQVRVADTATPTPPSRLTEEGVRNERLAMLRKRDPTLDAAVDTLDLELLD